MASPRAISGYRAPGSVPSVRIINTDDLIGALSQGYSDFMAMPSHLVFVGLIYPVLGIFLAAIAFGYDVSPLLFPLASGFALIGPVAGIGLYEISRRREAGLPTRWRDAFQVVRSPAIGAIVGMGLVLLVILAAWIGTAHLLYLGIMGSEPAASYADWLKTVLTTERGWALIVVGNAIGLAFAVLVLTISVIAFPLILDRNVGVGTAIATSRRAVLANPTTMLTWGLIVAVHLVIGSIPLFIGLAVVMPVLGHATWHLYRRVVQP